MRPVARITICGLLVYPLVQGVRHFACVFLKYLSACNYCVALELMSTYFACDVRTCSPDVQYGSPHSWVQWNLCNLTDLYIIPYSLYSDHTVGAITTLDYVY